MDLTYFSTGMALRMGCILDDLTSEECSIDVNITVEIPSKPRDILEYYISLLCLALSISVFMAWWAAFRGRWVVPWEWKLAGTPGRDLPEAENRHIVHKKPQDVLNPESHHGPTIETSILGLISIADKKPCYAQYLFEVSGHCCLSERVCWVSVVINWRHSLEMRRVKTKQWWTQQRDETRLYSDTNCSHLIAFQYTIIIQITISIQRYSCWMTCKSFQLISPAWIEFSDTRNHLILASGVCRSKEI